jgi:hypothetical protein
LFTRKNKGIENQMNSKEFYNRYLSVIENAVKDYGYSAYKSKQFVKISNGEVFHNIELCFSKNDIYIWYATYSLYEYCIDLGSGALAGRFPSEEGGLKVSDIINDEKIEDLLRKYIKQTASSQELYSSSSNIISSIPDGSKALPLLTKAYCLAHLGDLKSSKVLLNSFISLGLNFGGAKAGAEELVTAIDENRADDILNQNRENNIKKLRLKKYTLNS